MAALGRIGIVGAGNMGSAIIRGLLAKGLVKPDDLFVAEKAAGKAEALAAELGVQKAPWPMELEALDMLILATKPQDIPAAISGAKPALGPACLVVSVAAGLTLASLARELPPDQPLIRAMPNTPCLVGQGVIALAPAAGQDPKHLDTALEAFSAVGMSVAVSEAVMDAVTGLSGSGPAFVYLFIEALSDAGVLMGLDRPTALTLAAQTVKGAAAMVQSAGRHPAELKEMVTSPGGTTIAGLRQLENGGMRGLVMEAVRAAALRSRELGKS